MGHARRGLWVPQLPLQRRAPTRVPLRGVGCSDTSPAGLGSSGAGSWTRRGGPPPRAAPSVPPPPGPLARPRQAQLSIAAKNSPAPGQGGRMGPLGGDRQPATTTTTTTTSSSGELALPGGMLGEAPSDSDEVDGEVRALTARAFRSISGPPGARLDMCSLLGKEQFECVDVELESGEARKGHGKKRTVPKRQILLKRKERKETGFVPRGDAPAPQPDFRLNYKQFMKTASLDANTNKTRAASCLVKNVLAKKMQYEQRIRMEQKGLRGSSTSSGPSSAGTDLLGDGLEGKSSSLSRSDCSFSAEDLRGGGMPVAAVVVGNVTTTHPTKGVVLSEATRENVCKLKTTFNELNERIKYHEVMEGHWLPGTAEEPPPERIRYRQARALFEAQPGVGKVLDVAPRFGRAPKPWPSLRQRAICPGHPQPLPSEPDSLPAVPPRRTFTSRAQDVRLVPQNRHEEKPPAAPRQLPSPPARRSPPPLPPKPEEKGKGRIPQPRDVRKLVKSSYSLCFGTAGASRRTSAPASSAEPAPAAPLVIHCSSVCRREPAPQPGRQEVPAEPAPVCAQGSRSSPPRRSPVHITRVQATRRGSAAADGPPASLPRRERSELRVPPRAATAEGVPHMETHLHVLVGPRSREGFPAQSSAVLRTEKTVVLPPPPPSPTEGHGGPGGLSCSGDPHAGPVAGSTAHPQPGEPAARSAPEPPASKQGQQQPQGQLGSVGSGGSSGGSGSAAPFRGVEGGEGASARLPERREPWERAPAWPAATEPAPAAAPAENSNYLAIPEKAPKPAPVPKLPSVPSPASASFGTPAVPSPASASFGTPAVPNPHSAPFGTPAVPNPTSAPFGTSLVASLATAPFGTPAVPSLANAPFGTSAVPNPTSAPFGTPLVPNPASAPFGAPLVSKPASTSFGTTMVPSMTNLSFGYPSASSLASTSFGTPLVSNPTKSFGTSLSPYPANASFGTPLVPNVCGASFGTPLVPNPSSVSFGTPLVPSPSSTSFGTPLVPNSANASFGTLLVPNSANAFFGTPLVPSRSSTSFGTPLVPNSANASLGTPLVPSQSSTPFGTPLDSNPASSSFGSPLGTNPVPTSLGNPPVSSMASSFFGSPLVPNPPSAPPGAGVCPVPSGEVPWSKPSPEPPLPQPPEVLVAAEHPVPSAQPQPHLEDAPHLLRRTDGASPSSKSTPSSTKPFAPHLPTHRRMLVDPDNGKCYYMEPPRQPQLKTLYDPETGQYLEVLVPPVASHTGLYQAPFNPLVMPAGVYGSPYVPYSGFQGLPAPPAPSAPSPGEGPPAAGGPDCGYLESLYYIPTGMRASPGPGQPPARTSPSGPEPGPLLRM
uniref:DUF4585 domain-containing protein n=1 Tax=Strigops habroptila TaxID=2489341 RepID=A0A672UJC7_STRHB